MDIKKVSENVFEIQKGTQPCMRVPVRIYASDDLVKKMKQDATFKQATNAACIPGIYTYSIVLPDGHQGYGFPIGGVAATDYESGVISPGGVGYDINCGVRVLRTNLDEKDVRPKIRQLIDQLFADVPTGVGKQGKINLQSHKGVDEVLEGGSMWAVEEGYGWEDDLENQEANGRLDIANPADVPGSAKDRGLKQSGTLGSGNHFLEIQLVDDIYDERAAKMMGITRKGQVMIMIHSGSRGLGHQVCSEFIRTMTQAMRKYKIEVPDRELCCAPTTSPEGQAYLGAMSAAANYAFANRQAMMHWTREAFSKVMGQSPEDMDMKLIYDVAHNMGKVEEHDIEGKRTKVVVHRKGATRAFPPGHPDVPSKYRSIGQPVIIPGTMGTASYILIGNERSMKLSFGSTAHGAGRFLSRTQAKSRYQGREIQEQLAGEGIIVKATQGVVIAEEAPGAYKDVDEVVRVSDSIGIATKAVRLRPIGVIKG
ncbi:MAG: RNA-splicing ligase RtcB [Candidatus Thorarchaeota archaeon]|nr:MAG: RNA-splicing ligase RtcB [Candidatus Thorarchaeota archaeon]